MDHADGAAASAPSMPAWKRALTKAMAVAALSLVEDGALFHADLHMGNMLYCEASGSSERQQAVLEQRPPGRQK